MPFIYHPEEEKKSVRCETIPPYNGPYENFSVAYGQFRSSSPVGTIWQCPECSGYLFTVSESGTLLWQWVSWYHFKVRRIIRKVESKEETKGQIL